MHRLATLLNSPNEIIGAVVAIVLSSATMVVSTVQAFLAQIPLPADTGAWSFYGVLISSNIALAVALAWVLRWVGNTWIKEQREIAKLMTSLLEASNRQIESNNHVLRWMEDLVKASIHDKEKRL